MRVYTFQFVVCIIQVLPAYKGLLQAYIKQRDRRKHNAKIGYHGRRKGNICICIMGCNLSAIIVIIYKSGKPGILFLLNARFPFRDNPGMGFAEKVSSAPAR